MTFAPKDNLTRNIARGTHLDEPIRNVPGAHIGTGLLIDHIAILLRRPTEFPHKRADGQPAGLLQPLALLHLVILAEADQNLDLLLRRGRNFAQGLQRLDGFRGGDLLLDDLLGQDVDGVASGGNRESVDEELFGAFIYTLNDFLELRDGASADEFDQTGKKDGGFGLHADLLVFGGLLDSAENVEDELLFVLNLKRMSKTLESLPSRTEFRFGIPHHHTCRSVSHPCRTRSSTTTSPLFLPTAHSHAYPCCSRLRCTSTH